MVAEQVVGAYARHASVASGITAVMSPMELSSEAKVRPFNTDSHLLYETR